MKKGHKFTMEHREKLSEAKKGKVSLRKGYRKGQEKECLTCGIPFYQPPCDNAKFCSFRCAMQNRVGKKRNPEIGIKISKSKKGVPIPCLIKRENRICKLCSSIFTVIPSSKNIYCGIKCSSKARIGNPAWNKGLKGFRAGESHHWYGRNMSGINNPKWIEDRDKLKRTGQVQRDRRSSAYVTWRNSIYKRDNYKCKINDDNCNGKIEAHHILSFTHYPELRYNINNGITLCLAHHPRKRAEEKRLIPVFKELVSVS